MDVLAGLNPSKFEDRITCKLSRKKTIVFALQDLHLIPVVIAHNLDFLSGVTDRFHAMSAGKIVRDDTVDPHYHMHAHQSGRFPHNHDS